MLIDWFTVVAQLVNFLILLVALKYLLYDRILEAMAERKRRFVAREEETERLRKEAEEESDRIKAERREIESNWEAMIDEARREADERRRELLDEARSQVEEQERQWRETVRSKREQLIVDLQRETGERAVSVARRALTDLAHADLEDAIVATFLDRLGGLGGSDDELTEALDADEPVRVCTAFDLSDDQRASIREALHDVLGDPAREIEWERDPDLIAGVALVVGARRIGWAIDSYLDGVGDRFAEMLRQGARGLPEDENGEREIREQAGLS